MINGATVWKMCKVARLVDEKGSVVILKNNVPRYMIVEFSLAAEEQMASDEDVMDISRRLIKKNRQAMDISRRLIKKNRQAYEVLAKINN